ncbi:MAG: TerC family protein [Xylophilus ampelinus]
MEWLTDPAIWGGLLTLIVLEIVLGIDNLIFIAILAEKLPPHQRDRARITGLSLALVMRLGLLSVMSWLITLTTPLLSFWRLSLSARDLILLVGGLFLLFKATTELHERLEGVETAEEADKGFSSFGLVVTQIVVLDAVFSLDSVITAVGMVDHLPVMMAAVVIAIAVMLAASKPLTRFVNAHPTVVVLCLSFLLMIGLSLVAEAFGFHLPKGYLYAAIGFSIMIEFLNQLARRNLLRHEARIPMRDRTAASIFRLLGGTARRTSQAPGESAAGSAAPSAPPAFGVEERNMVTGVLTLAERSVHSVMTPRADIEWVDTQEDADALREQLTATGHSLVPVCRGELDKVVGIARTTDLVTSLLTGGGIDEAAMLRAPLVVPESISVIKLMELLRQSRGRMALVSDEYGTILGLVTPIDLLEAIAGEFPTEGEVPDIQAQAPDHWIVNGLTDLHTLEQVLETPDLVDEGDDYNTLAGFLLARLGQLPAPGQVISDRDLRFEVLVMDGRRIAQVDVRRLPPEAALPASDRD